MNHWTLSTRRDAHRVFLGIPDYVGARRSGAVSAPPPSLEEVAGEDWSADLLRLLLPVERAWAWCTQSSIYRRTGLPTTKAPATVDSSGLTAVVTRSRLFHPTTLAFVPGETREAQEKVIYWAGTDTEQVPDHIWVASAAGQVWNADDVLTWCEDPTRWTDLGSVAEQPAERLLILFDRQISCVLPASTADEVMSDLTALASRWGLAIVAGRPEDPWVIHR